MVTRHYNATMPRLNKAAYGGFIEERLVAAISFGWGSRPRHTIQRLFPSLDTRDYFEIGKMALDDSLPKNSGTKFLSVVLRLLRTKFPDLKLVFTWADGMYGKPGYVYQAANFLYGGFIWTDTYLTKDGRRVHPLQLRSETHQRNETTALRTNRPSVQKQRELGWQHFSGKQFRYAYFLCPKKEQERLLKESTTSWSRDNYPKQADLDWKPDRRTTAPSIPQPKFLGVLNDYRERTQGSEDWLTELEQNVV